MKDRFLTPKETAAFLAMNLFTLYKKASLGLIPSYKMDKLRRFRMSEIKKWCEEKRAST